MKEVVFKFVLATVFAFLAALSSFYYKTLIYIFGWFSPDWLTWNKYSESMLRALEKKILQIVKTAYRGWYVDIGPVVGPADKIWTISLNTESPNTPLVLLHGLGAGVALWCLNLDAFAANRPVYAFDLLGFGRSSRPTFSSDAMEAEQQMVKSIEEWRKEMKLDNFVLLGHSMGGFLAASYALSYPDHVKHLVLADPWGFPERPQEFKELPLWIRTLSYMLQPFNPLAGIRVAGPLGPWFINTLRPDITKKYASAIEPQELIPQYIYQCNSQTPSGESAFHSMMSGFGWAKNPMVNRIDKMRKDISITLLYGSRSWIDHSAAEIIKFKRIDSYFKLQVITGAGHHVYADKPEAFNQIVLDACAHADNLGKTNYLALMPSEYNEESENSESETGNQSKD
ncbi:(Lyso)-N-acylphosphatidylethanolamine lipase isoform X1 [Tribolium castaneum]|uniref:1-acylglycerol-3-phosphate O-acyltransferase ABHD5-like Protein n=1 Tax=Tribolium castaneum TaxID=7070 RepID=D6WUA5_TRICA|nr:PREDICTED: protein ABHD4-like isoform X1 [Tribolium castaneum]EFA06792.2 1-acylglycerol-3-phosphate O-acyltransferase ABHD5-like Protein [Tribolium castaneum]|eukprot:XP_008195547.1 PREDICTED: protein ABHD4-like isoform X1 [Tribolium castaneum]